MSAGNGGAGGSTGIGGVGTAGGSSATGQGGTTGLGGATGQSGAAGQSAAAGQSGSAGAGPGCGTCNSGQPCANGFCLDPITAGDVGRITYDDLYVYTQTGLRAPRADGALAPIVTGSLGTSADFFEVDDLNLYVETVQANMAPVILAAPKSGGAFAPLITTLTKEGLLKLSAADGNIYYWQDDTGANFGIYRVARTGGTPELWVKTGALTHIRAIAGTVVWSFGLANAGSSNGVYLKLASDAPDLSFAFQPLPGSTDTNGEMALDASGVYWATSAGSLMHAPISSGASSELGTSTEAGYGGPEGLTLDQTYLYFWLQSLTTSASLLDRVPKTGGSAVTLASFDGIEQVAPGAGGVFVSSNGVLYFAPTP